MIHATQKTVSDATRQPVDYVPTDHYTDRITDPSRPITATHADRAIERGAVDDNDGRRNSWRFVHRIDGVDVVAVCGRDRDLPVLRGITAYCAVADYDAAVRSTTWDESDVDVMVLLGGLNGERTVGVDLFQIDVDDAVPYHGHALVCYFGHRSALCVDCGHVADDGRVYKAKRCRGD